MQRYTGLATKTGARVHLTPDQVLTHAARAAAKQLNNFSHSVTAREGPWSGQVRVRRAYPTMNKMLMAAGPRVRRALVKVPWLLVFCQASKTAFRSHCARPYSNQSPSRAPRAATRGGLFSCFAAALDGRCASTILRHYALLEEQVRRARSDDGRL